MKDNRLSKKKNGESLTLYNFNEESPGRGADLDQILKEGLEASEIMAMHGDLGKQTALGSLFDVYGIAEEEPVTERYPSQSKLMKALELNPAMIAILGRWGHFEFVNPKFTEITGYSSEDVLERDTALLTGEVTTESAAEFVSALQKGRIWKGEMKQFKKNGESYSFDGSLTPLEDSYGFINGFILSGQDVTPFKKTENKLHQTLKEKNVLLAELHHRVKNNLAIVSGLMQLQAFNENSRVLQNRLLTSAGRVQSMASMHEALYESQSLSNIEFSQIVKRIVESVGGLYREEYEKVEIKHELEVVNLNINQAHPLSLILHEVISNVFKHAFEHQEAGKIWVKLYQKGSMVFLSISDSGVGLPMKYQVIGERKKTTGYELLNLLVDQLEGEYQYTADFTGTNFYLYFEISDAKGASNARLGNPFG